MKQRKRIMSGLLAILILVITIGGNFPLVTSYAAEFNGKNIWTGGSESLFGYQRSYLYRWSDGYQNTFCITPRMHMGKDVSAYAGRYHIDDESIPYINDRSSFRKLALICDWYDRKAGSVYAPNDSYGAAQAAIWAIVDGDWDRASYYAEIISQHVSGNVMGKFYQLKNYVETADSISNGLPEWCSQEQSMANPYNMTLQDGRYQILFDFSAFPDIAQVRWEVPNGYSYAINGNTITFYYHGTGSPAAMISGSVPDSLAVNKKNSETMAIFTPRNIDRDQAMISAGLIETSSKIYINIGGTAYQTPEGGVPLVEIFRHKEVFETDYRISLKKYCAETGLDLQGSTFEVLEAFDDSQLDDGSEGTVGAAYMSPKPAVWKGFKVCGLMITDQNGDARHHDHKTYIYNKIYCNGHPEPDYLEVPDAEEDEESGEITNQAEIQAVIDENERLRAEWENLILLCEEESDFHSIHQGEAREMMLADRDETYQTFCHLKYQYTVREKSARPGYIIHGGHNDDTKIEIVISDSSQAGANIEKVTGKEAKILPAVFNDRVAKSFLTGTNQEWNPIVFETHRSEPKVKTNLSQIRTVTKNVDYSSPLATGSEADRIVQKATLSDAPKASDSNARKSDDKHWQEFIQEFSDYDLPLFDNLHFNSFMEWLGSFKGTNDSVSYQYYLHPKERYRYSQLATLSQVEEKGESSVQKFWERVIGSRRKKDVVTIRMSLPDPIGDHEAPVIPASSGNFSYQFEIENHRTEGEIHINKRDLELFLDDEEESYGKVQGDATLEGAVYGLFAGADLIHPDGKTGAVYHENELVAKAATDKNGDASFLCFTEESITSEKVNNRTGTWIGQPLLLGSYYIKELSRSEGYELSVSGIQAIETNHRAKAEKIHLRAGEINASGLSHRVDDQDGSWNETTITYYKTEQGYDVVISGYPAGSQIYEVSVMESSRIEPVVVDRQLVPKTDILGLPIYQKASGGELRLDAVGNPIPLAGEDIENPQSETWFTSHRLDVYPAGTAVPSIDLERWMDVESIDENYIKEEVNHMLGQIGYHVLATTDGDGAPWLEIALLGDTNETIGTEILDWFAGNDFYDSGAVESIFEDETGYKVRLFYDYRGQPGPAIYDGRNGRLYIKKKIEVIDGATNSYAWISYPAGSFSISGFYAMAAPKKVFTGMIPFGADINDYLVEKYQPLFERYAEGELLLDLSGNRIPEMEWKYIYSEEEEIVQQEILTPILTEFDVKSGTYSFHVDNSIDWDQISEKQSVVYRIQAPLSSIEVDGKKMDYADYLVQVAGAGVSVFASLPVVEENSYIRYVNLTYPGQIQVYQDGRSRNEPIQVLERVIKQSIRVTKDISKESYEINNTYRIHRDPFTVLFGGYSGAGKKYITGFHFKLYLVSDLVHAGLLNKNADGSYEYKALFDDESKRSQFDQYAVKWDRPAYDKDGDLTTIHASEGNGTEPYYGQSVMLPYGTYVIVEQMPKGLVNIHYDLDDPKEVILPFVPWIDENGSIHDDIPAKDYLYFSAYTPEQLQEKFLIRFNEENHVIEAHNNDGNFKVYKYGLKPDLVPDIYENSIIAQRYRFGVSEDAKLEDGVYYERLYDLDQNEIDYGVTLNGVEAMKGISTAINAKYAQALVPWSVLDPRYGEIINDAGDVGNRESGLVNGEFNFIGFAKRHFENIFYSSKLRVEKLDAKTGENLIHEGALFKIYAAKRDVIGKGSSSVTGTGRVMFETLTVTGTRPELEARGDVEEISWDHANQIYTGRVTRPIYDENEQIFMLDKTGNDIGIFKAFSTEREVLKADGTVSREKVGYIETFQPLGAGVYVIVEVQAPAGYQKSKPIAFEIYKDQVSYYENGDQANRREANRYQYVVPITTSNQTKYEDVSNIVVYDQPSKLVIHKVEDGDQKVGDINGLDGLQNVNDKGDLLTYLVRGKKQYLEARGDVEDIEWDDNRNEYFGTVTKTFDKWSEVLISGTEDEFLFRDDSKPLYEINTGFFSGYGIIYQNYVSEAVMSLYEGVQIEPTGLNSYQGVEVVWNDSAIESITAYKTGSHLEITTKERDSSPPFYPIWNTEEIKNQPIPLFYYDLNQVATEFGEREGELQILDQRGNHICFADSITGMAYTYDDYGNMIAYRVIDGEKVLAQSIAVHHNEDKEQIYINIQVEEDELGFPLYYQSGEVTYLDERWTTDGTPHEISRLPFGAYILEETEVPYHTGYIKSIDMGMILRESSNDQHFYFQNIFTKLNLAKIDVSTKEEIRDAQMTLYTAVKLPDDSEKGYYLEKDQVYSSWISGYEYDDNGNLKLDESGSMIPTSKPHWLDHIPVGYYILEETIVPYDQGYVQAESIEIHVKETGIVQTGFMEDDYSALEIKKMDAKTGEVLPNDRSARLTLYHASLDENGNPLTKTSNEMPDREIPVYQESSKVVSWQTNDGKDILNTEREVTDEYGETKLVYDYIRHPIETTKKGYYYITEKGTTMFHYLPIGHYVLVEEETPQGYATADPILINIEDVGQQIKTHYYEMKDVPLTIEVWKTSEEGGKVVKDAFLQLFKVDDQGIRESSAFDSWYSGYDGIFTVKDKLEEKIPEGYQIGDLKPHRIEYIPQGDYVLVESIVSYGFLQAADINFRVIDSPLVLPIEMVDEIPVGLLELEKRDQDNEAWLLEGAAFELTNKTTGVLVETLITDHTGKATASNAVPIGFLNEAGKFEPYIYEIVEVDAPITHMLNTVPFEFQFQYQDQFTEVIKLLYHATDKVNQMKVSKKLLTTQEELPGAEMMVVNRDSEQIVDSWISTGQPHYVNGMLPGKYLLVEVMPPHDGYAKAESIEFTITENMLEIPHVMMYDDHTKTQIAKVDGVTGQLLSGARLQLSDLNGKVLKQWITQVEAEMIYGLKPGEYILEELEAPSGYKEGKPVRIKIQDKLEIQEIRYQNYLINTKGGKDDPEREVTPPEKPSIIGEISANYHPELETWWQKWLEWLPKLGDHIKDPIVFGIFILGLLSLIILTVIFIKRRKLKKIWGIFMVLLFLLSCIFAQTIQAALQQPDGGIAITDIIDAKHYQGSPPEVYYDQKQKQYSLVDYDVQSIWMPANQEWMEEKLLFEAVENKELIPDMKIITFTNNLNNSIQEEFPVQVISEIAEYWLEHFSFPITFHNYKADSYRLGALSIPAKATESILSGYEVELLNYIGLDQERYHIMEIHWNGEPYTDEQGVLCRDAIASGRKKVNDYLVTYGGYYQQPDREWLEIKKIYQPLAVIAKEKAVAETNTKIKTVSEVLDEMVAESPKQESWGDRIRRMVKITITLGGVILLAAVITGYLLRVKKRKID